MKMQLYHRWHCPYSSRVRETIQRFRLGGQVEMKELDEVKGAEQELQDLTGRTQTPCLVVDGKPMLESVKIVNWLEKQFRGRNEAHP